MSIQKSILVGGAVVAFASVALAHHITKAFTYVHGPEIMEKIDFYNQTGNFGVPPYALGTLEAAHHYSLTHGDSFTVSDGLGNSQVITFAASDFVDIVDAEVDEILAAVNNQLTIGEAAELNGYLAIRGIRGGPAQILTLQDGPGAPLAKFTLPVGSVSNGESDIPLVLSTPLPGPGIPDLSGHRYLILASTTDGVFTMNGVEVPIGLDATTKRVHRMTRLGLIPTFRGAIDSNGDAFASFDSALLGQIFPAGVPSQLYFSYVVLSSDASTVVYASNRFTIDIHN